MQIDVEQIKQGLGGLVIENWALQREIQRLQSILASVLPKAPLPPVNGPSVEGKSDGEGIVTPLMPPESSGD